MYDHNFGEDNATSLQRPQTWPSFHGKPAIAVIETLGEAIKNISNKISVGSWRIGAKIASLSLIYD